MKTNIEYSIAKINDKFVVTKNSEPIVLPKSSGSTIVTEFESKDDAERYLSILKTLQKR